MSAISLVAQSTEARKKLSSSLSNLQALTLSYKTSALLKESGSGLKVSGNAKLLEDTWKQGQLIS